MMNNKKGVGLVGLFVMMFVSLLFSIFLGITVYSFNLVTTTLAIDVEVGQVNLGETVDATLGQINTGIIGNADTIGIIFLFGMCLLLILNGYFTGDKYPKLFFIVDFFILALFFIPAIYISQVYETLINSTSLFEDTFINVIPKVSKFMLNLPVIMAIVGIITMIVSYAGIKQKKPQSVAGF